MKPFTTLAIIVFALVALAHLYRLIRPFEVIAAGHMVPQWVSAAGLIVAGGLALMLWRESRR
jgi:uncharacterized membrane protein